MNKNTVGVTLSILLPTITSALYLSGALTNSVLLLMSAFLCGARLLRAAHYFRKNKIHFLMVPRAVFISFGLVSWSVAFTYRYPGDFIVAAVALGYLSIIITFLCALHRLDSGS